jgi:hypothetical protein
MLVGRGGGLYVISATTLCGVSQSGSAVKVKQATSLQKSAMKLVDVKTDLGRVAVVQVWATEPALVL